MSLPATIGEEVNADLPNSANTVAASKGFGPTTTYPTVSSFSPGTKMESESRTNVRRRTGSKERKSDTLDTQTVLNYPLESSPPMYSLCRQAAAGNDSPDCKPSTPNSKREFSWKELFTLDRRAGKHPTAKQSLQAIVSLSWLNILLVFIPISWTLHLTIHNDTVIFISAFLAIIPLTKLIRFATEELCVRVGGVLGTLLNVSLGNAVVFIISIIALTKCQLRLVQAALTGSIVSNLLFLSGMCFFVRGTKYGGRSFSVHTTQLNNSLLMFSVAAVIVPTAFTAVVPRTNTTDIGTSSSEIEGERILMMSRGTSCVLLLLYGCIVAHLLRSRFYLPGGKMNGSVRPSRRYPDSLHKPSSRYVVDRVNDPYKKSEEGLMEGEVVNTSDGPHVGQHSSVKSEGDLEVSARSFRGDSQAGTLTIEDTPIDESDAGHDPRPRAEGEDPQISVWAAWLLVLAVMVQVAFTAEVLVSHCNIFDSSQLSQEWVGFILLPFVSGGVASAAEQLIVIGRAEFDIGHTIDTTVGSSIQVALVVTPLNVILAWILGKPLTLSFNPFEAVILLFSVITYNCVVADGQTNWMEGILLMCQYVIIAFALFFYPGVNPASQPFVCVVRP